MYIPETLAVAKTNGDSNDAPSGKTKSQTGRSLADMFVNPLRCFDVLTSSGSLLRTAVLASVFASFVEGKNMSTTNSLYLRNEIGLSPLVASRHTVLYGIAMYLSGKYWVPALLKFLGPSRFTTIANALNLLGFYVYSRARTSRGLVLALTLLFTGINANSASALKAIASDAAAKRGFGRGLYNGHVSNLRALVTTWAPLVYGGIYARALRSKRHPGILKYIERKIEEMQKKDEQVRRNMSRKNAEHPPPGGDLSGTVDKLDAETLETKMMLLPFVDNLEFIDIHIESRSNPKRLDFESFSTFDASALSQNFGDESCTDSTRREILGDAVVGKEEEEEEEEEGWGQKEKGIAAESFGASISSAINHAIVLSRGRYVTFCGKLERLKGIVCTSNISTNRPLMWVMTLLSDVWIFRAVQESRASRVCVAMPQSLLSCFTSKFGLPLLIKTNAYELLVALDMFSEDSSLIRDANMSTNPTISSSGAAKSTDVSRIATVLDSCVVRCAISAGILAEIHNFTSFLRELRSDEDLLFYLHARKVIQRVCNLEPGLRGPSPFRSCQRLPAGLIVFATHPRFSDGSKFPLLSIKAVRAVLREIFRTKTTIDTDLKSVSERERLVSYVVESKVKPHFVHVPGLIATLIARYERETVLFSPVGVSPRGVKEGAERKSRGAFMSRTEVEDIRNDEALWITVPQLLNIMIDDFRNTDYNIVRSLRGEGVDPESEDKCQGLLRINRLVKSQAHDAKREVLIDKLHQERLLLTERESKVQQLRVTAMAAASVQERITCKTALLVAENDCKLQQMAVKEAQLAVNASLTRSDQIWTDVMHQNSQTYRKRRREMRGERRGGVNAATNLTLKRYAVWVETQRVRAKKEARKEKIVQSLVKDHMQQLLDLQVRSAICIQRTYRERLGLRRARNVAFAEITRRRRIRDKRLRQEYEAATTIACARRKQLARRELRAAKTLQRIWRGRNGRLLVARLHSQRNAAITLQSRWRAIKGRERHRVLRVEWVLQSAETSNFEMMLWHLECGRGFVRNGDGTNALMTAAHAASKRIVKLCLRWGFRLEDTDSAGRNVLHYASASFAPGADRLIMYLLLHGARDLLNVKDSEGYTPLASAVRAGTVSCARLLREAGAMLIGPPGTGMNLLHVAVASGRGPMLQMLICNESFYGASAEEALKHANETDLDGLTPTHYACCVGYPKLVRTLADVGVDVDCADQYGRTLLHYAVCSQKALCVEALLAMSANPSHRDADGLSALHHAALNDFGDEIDALCKSERTDVDQCNSNGETALHIAADHGNARAAKELCACAANSGFKNPDGNTPLHIACMNGHDKVVEILLEYAADPNMRNLDGQTPIGFARLGNHGRVVANFKGIFLEQVCEVAPARVEKDSDAWVKRKDELTGETYFYNRETKVEMTDVESLSSMYVKTRTREVKWKPRIVFRPNANQLSKTDYLDYYAKEKRKEVQMAKEKRAAVLFQREYRRSKARWKFRLHQIQTRNAAKLQRKWRQHFATRRVAKMRLKKTAAGTIQRNWRAHLLLTCARRDRRHAKLRKRQNEAAEIVQRRWRVKRARRVYVKLKTAWKLSSMTRSDWDKYMDRLTGHDRMPVRSWRAFEEWEAAELGLEEVVHFYRNRINGNCSWEQPATWKREDEKMRREERQRRERGYTDTEVDAARTLQSIWRGKVLREDFASLLKSVRIMRTCERRYLERPNNLIVLCNYMIFVLTIKQDRDKARPLVEEAMKRMIKRGPDTPFILYTYGIFLAATGEEDWDVINNIFERAHAGDNSGNAYKLARKGFYRMATLILKGRERAVAHFQYALCLQFCVRQYASARAHYIKALSLLADDHRSREYARVVDNFNYLMTEIIGADHDGIEEFNRHQEVLAKKKAEEWNARGRFEFYAVKLQSAARVLLAKIATRRIRNSEEYRLRTKMKRISGDRDGGPPSDAIVLRRRRLSSSTSSRVARSNAESGNDDKSFPPGTVDHDDDVESLESLPSGIVDHDVESLESLPSGIVDNDESDDGGGSLPPGIVDSVVNEPPPGLDLFTTSRSDSGAPPGLDDLPPGVDFANSRGRSSIEDDRIPPGTDSHCVGKESESDEDEETERNGVSRWETCIDAESGRVYYYDTLSGKSQWRRPSSFVADILWEEAFDRPSGNRYFVNLSNGDTQWDRPQGVSDEAIRWLEDEEGSVSNGAAGSEWEKVRDDQNRMYWYNVRTNDSVWSLPGRAQVGEHGRCIAAASRGDSTEETEDGTGRWEVCRDASSDRTYYYNRETGVSQWDCPRAVDAENNPSSELSLSDEHPAEVGGEWEICTDESSSNRVYYYNRRTGESQWDMPVCG
eukprot:g2279.t1